MKLRQIISRWLFAGEHGLRPLVREMLEQRENIAKLEAERREWMAKQTPQWLERRSLEEAPFRGTHEPSYVRLQELYKDPRSWEMKS